MHEEFVDVSFSKLFKLINNDTKSISLIKNIACNSIESGFLMKGTIKLLLDSSEIEISESNKLALVRMLNTYFNNCYEEAFKVKGLEQLIKFAKLENYKIEAINGLRYATFEEVKQGVRGLKAEISYPLGEDVYRKLCLLEWTISGNTYFYKQAGFNLEYADGKVKTNMYEMICDTALKLVELFDWMKNKKEFKEHLKTLRAIKKNGGGHKQSGYATDEVTEEISIKQLVYFINKDFEHNSSNKDIRLALHLAIKGKKNLTYLTPMEICFMRVQYEKHLENKKTKKDNINFELKNKCERLIEARKCKKLNANHFAFKIVKTLESNGYRSCSQKQMAIIDSALQEYEKELKKVQIIDYSVNTSNIQSENDNAIEKQEEINKEESSTTNTNIFMSDDYFDSMIGTLPDVDFDFDILGN